MENQKLEREFYLQDTVEIAKKLLGKTLVHKVLGKTIKAKITETEAYLGLEDGVSFPIIKERTSAMDLGN